MSFLQGLKKRLRREMPSQSDIRQALATLQAPFSKQDIVSSGLLEAIEIEGHSVRLRIVTPVPLEQDLQMALQRACQQSIQELSSAVREVRVSIVEKKSVPHEKSPIDAAPRGLAGVKHILAVASGKGGVGKSSTAVSLAYSLHQQGAKVGLLDADVYGPSIPQLTGVGKPQAMDGQLVVPPEMHGIKIISPQMFAEQNQAQILRGPMTAQIVRQLMTQVAWGDLDYLVVDYPPGTGDIQLTISQTANLSGAVIVTTPQDVARIDVRKAIAMFQTLNVPILGVIETMSYFVCDECEKKHFIFRQGGAKKLCEEFKLPLLAEIPLDPRFTELCDQGKPAVLVEPQGVAASAYEKAAAAIGKRQMELQQISQQGLGYFKFEWQPSQPSS